jgi:uncharacterized protein YndB with AHSA1/START domain
MTLEFRVELKIQKPVAEVFDAVVDPAKLCVYFTSESTGPLATGATVNWKFAEFPDLDIPVTVHEVRPNELIRFEWPTNQEDYNTTVTMTFEALAAEETLVSVAESGWRETDKGQRDSYLNCYGWTHMICCLKAYLEHGIDLRAGSF